MSENIVKFKKTESKVSDPHSNLKYILSIMREMLNDKDLAECAFGFGPIYFGPEDYHEQNKVFLINFFNERLKHLIELVEHEEFMSTYEMSDLPYILNTMISKMDTLPFINIAFPFVNGIWTVVLVKLGNSWMVSDIFENHISQRTQAFGELKFTFSLTDKDLFGD